MHEIAQDVRLAVRALARAPAFTLAVLVTLALGIGASTAIFSVIHGVLLRPLPYPNGDRLVHVTQPARLAGVKNVGLSPMETRELRTRASTVVDLVEYHSMPFVILGGSEPERVQTGVVSAGFFQTLGVKPLLGRLFAEGEDLPGAPAVLLLSYGYWQKHLGGDPAVVGRSFTMNDRVHTVVGVLPNIPQYPAENDVYMPVDSCPFRRAAAWDQTRAVRGLTVFIAEQFVAERHHGVDRTDAEPHPCAAECEAQRGDAGQHVDAQESQVIQHGDPCVGAARGRDRLEQMF